LLSKQRLIRSAAGLAIVASVAFGVAAGPSLVTAQTAASASIGDSLVVNTDALNLRETASASGIIDAVLYTGDAVTIVDGPVSADGYDWYQVSTADGTGWVDGEYLDTTVTGSTSSDLTIGGGYVVNTDALNLRADASTSATVDAVLATGDDASVLDGPVSADGYDWYQVSTSSGTGWVDGEYLATSVTVSTVTTSSTGLSIGSGYVVNTDALNLRTEATTSATVDAVMATGDAATVLDGPVSADGYDWYQVSTTYGTGWVDGEYLASTTTLAAASDLSVGSDYVVSTDALNLRADASISATVDAVLVTGDAATIVSGPVSADGYDWYQISTSLGTGWVDGEYLTLA